MTHKTILADSQEFIGCEPQTMAIQPDSASAPKHTCFITPDRLSLLFDSDDDDEALLAQLKLERKLFHDLYASESPADLSARVATALRKWGFADFTFLRLDPLAAKGRDTGAMPKPLLSSYRGDGDDAMGHILVRATAGDPKTQHRALLYQFIASLPAGSGDTELQYVLIVSADHANAYIAPSGFADRGRYIGVSQLLEGPGERDQRRRITEHQRNIQLLADMIESIGREKFAALFKRKEYSKSAIIQRRPRALLDILAKKDVTLREAADLLQLSPDTINKHVASAKAALGTTTLSGTIWKAVNEGLIDGGNPA